MVKAAEVLSASMERLLLSLRFTGKVSVVMQNGRVLKSGYEEGYFRQRSAGVDDDRDQLVRAKGGSREKHLGSENLTSGKTGQKWGTQATQCNP